jgi:YVTN family beta-propeller protein
MKPGDRRQKTEDRSVVVAGESRHSASLDEGRWRRKAGGRGPANKKAAMGTSSLQKQTANKKEIPMRRIYWSVAFLMLTAAGLSAQTVTTTVGAGSNPHGVAVNPVTNKIYVSNNGSANITVIDGATNATATVGVGTAPFAVAVNPVTNKIYVANWNSNDITVIDGATNATTTVGVGIYPNAVAVNPVTNKIYVANYNGGNVTVIDGASNTVTATVKDSSAIGPAAVALNPATNKIYVANLVSNNVTVIDGATNATTTVGVGNAPWAVAVNPATNKIYVANDMSDNVTVIDGASDTATATVAAGSQPYPVAVNPVTNKIYVANKMSNNVTVIDGATNGTTTVDVGSFPYAVAVNSVTNKIYVANGSSNFSNNVTVIDGATNATITVTDSSAQGPYAVAVNPVTNKIYVANAGSNNVTVIAYPFNVLYGVNSADDSLSIIDPATGRVTLIGPLDPNNMLFTTPIAMAVRPSDGKIFVWNNSPVGGLVTVDPCSGLGTKVNESTPDQGILYSLSFTAGGGLVGFVDNEEYAVDQSTGVKTLIGVLGQLSNTDRVQDADLSSDGYLYAIVSTPASPADLRRLAKIDPLVGSVALIGAPLSPDLGRLWAVAFDPTGKLIGSADEGVNGSVLFDISPVDGTITNIRALVPAASPQGMDFGPACVPLAQAQPLNPNGGTNLYQFQNNLYNYKVTYPAFSEPPANLVVQPILISQTDLTARLAGQFPGATLVPYDGTGGFGVLFRATCQDSSGNPVTCPETTGPYDVYTSWNPPAGQTINYPAFLMAAIAPVGQQAWMNIFTAYSQARIDPTGAGRTKGGFSDFVFVEGITGTPPTIAISTPQDGAVYALNQSVLAEYGCGTTPGLTCLGTVPLNSPIDTSSYGSKTFEVNAIVSSGPSADKKVNYEVAVYNTDGCLLYDPNRSVKKGATFPIKLQICDANGYNLSSPGIVLTAQGVSIITSGSPGPLEDSGNANPDSGFRFDSTLGVGGGYIYNLSTKGLSSGTWKLKFKITGDETPHWARFGVK